MNHSDERQQARLLCKKVSRLQPATKFLIEHFPIHYAVLPSFFFFCHLHRGQNTLPHLKIDETPPQTA